MKKLSTNLIALVVALAVWAASARAQQDQSGNAGQATQGSVQASGQQGQPASPVSVPTGPVTGAFTGFLNNLEEGRSMLQYGFNASESGDSNPTGAPGASSFLALTSVSGHLTLTRVQPRSDLTVQVFGGGLIYDTMSADDAGMAGLSIGDSIQFRHWTLLLGNQLYYLPQTPFGFSGGLLNGLGSGTFGGLTTPNPLAIPQNSILSPLNQQLTENASAQANFTVSARTTWTASATYSLTDFVNGGSLPSSGYSFGTGYNYQLSSRDTIGVGFTAGFSDYGVTTNSLENFLATVNYGHRFSDRLAVALSGGGSDYRYLSPSAAGRISNITYTATAAVNYLLGRSSLQLSAIHQTFGGGGYLYGGIQTLAQGSATRQISRFWQVSGSVGYGDVSGLASTPTSGISYHSLYGSASLSRQVNPNVTVFFQTVVSHQTIGGSGCVPGVPCGNPFTQYVASAGINWNFRAVPLN